MVIAAIVSASVITLVGIIVTSVVCCRRASHRHRRDGIKYEEVQELIDDEDDSDNEVIEYKDDISP